MRSEYISILSQITYFEERLKHVRSLCEHKREGDFCSICGLQMADAVDSCQTRRSEQRRTSEGIPDGKDDRESVGKDQTLQMNFLKRVREINTLYYRSCDGRWRLNELNRLMQSELNRLGYCVEEIPAPWPTI